jgi:hypothetical protein
LDAIGADHVVGLVAAVPDRGTGGGEYPLPCRDDRKLLPRNQDQWILKHPVQHRRGL